MRRCQSRNPIAGQQAAANPAQRKAKLQWWTQREMALKLAKAAQRLQLQARRMTRRVGWSGAGFGRFGFSRVDGGMVRLV
jgi:hypothetical protein